MITATATFPVDMAATLQTSPCTLCPRMCKALRDRGQLGVCGADNRILVARAALHFWEEPPLSGTAGSGTIFFSHCPLQCVYCQNDSISTKGVGREVSVERLAQICLELQEQGALNINCVTPTHYTPFIMQAIEQARLNRPNHLTLPVVWNIAGYERVETIKALAQTVDIYLTDFKYADPTLAYAYSRVRDYRNVAIAALDAMVETCGDPLFDEVDGQPRLRQGVVVRHLLLPGGLADSQRVVELVHRRYGAHVLLSLMNQYTPILTHRAASGDPSAAHVLKEFPQLAKTVPEDEYEQLLTFADELGVQDYFWQQGAASAESFIPVWDGAGVSSL